MADGRLECHPSHPGGMASEAEPGMYGGVWEWTSSSYVAYPGYDRRPVHWENTTANSCATNTCFAVAASPRAKIICVPPIATLAPSGAGNSAAYGLRV